MFKTPFILQKEYKDFFEVTDFLATDTVDFTYKKTIVTEESIFKQENEDTLVSFEKLNVTRTLAIYNYLIYKLPSIQDEETRKWYVKSIRFFEHTLSKINNSTSFITRSCIFINNCYKKIDYSGDKTVGRLYCFHSIQILPREIRYYLFKDEYVDFDIVNAHPSILYLYSKKHNLVLNGTLKRYIENRSSVMLEIQQELGVDKGKVKKSVLKLLNKTWKNSTGKTSKTLSELDKDFQTIRNHLWSSFINGNLQNYKPAVNKSIDKKKNQYILSDGTVDHDKLVLLKKVSLQSFYCQTQESVHIQKLVAFLRQEYEKFINKGFNKKFTDYYPSADKKVELGAKHTLFTIPFFDGLYISSPNKAFMGSLNSLVENYNKHISDGVLFLQKDIEERVERIPDTDELRKFTIIYEWLGRSSAKYYLHVLMNKIGLQEHILTQISQFDFYQKSWEIDYKKFTELIKSNIYKTLLEYPIKNERDIVKIIKEL